jgi:uncharacterized protein with ATP-grasp and redox domains
MSSSKPSLSPPEPLRGSEVGTFTHHSVVNRLPEIGRRMLAENTFPAQVESRLAELFNGIPEERIRYLSDEMAPDAVSWSEAIEPHLEHNWLQVPWFFAETYFYRRIIEATGYFGEGDRRGIDPFSYQKDEGLASSSAAINALSDRVEAMMVQGVMDGRALANLLRVDLWSNQADLSLWPVGSASDPAHGDEDQKQAHILVDDTSELVEYVFNMTLPAKRVDFLVDNAGIELVVDLGLAVYMLRMDIAECVYLNVKAHPTFVSDVIAGDVHKTATMLASSDHRATASLGTRAQQYLDEGRLQLGGHFFWTSPLAMWEMPEDVRQDLGRSALIISKGDANYRRLLGDRHWPFTTPFDDIMSYIPAPIAALRTLKSEIACGLLPGQPEMTGRRDSRWLTNGRWGVIQFSNPIGGRRPVGRAK